MIITDLVFTKSGFRKTIIKYSGKKGYCFKCRKRYKPNIINELGTRKFGHNLIAWIVYQRIVLRLPYEIITENMEEMFNERIALHTAYDLIAHFADKYAKTEKIIQEKILESPFVHVDETKINIQGTNYYAWVFTDGYHVIFKLTETRESTVVHDMLSGYSGVLISDFYGGYDSVKCRQQKCWVHLIRDLNDDLWKEPFNTELELFVLEVKNLILPILQTTKKYGLKNRYLNKYKKSVEKFYTKNIDNHHYKNETVVKYQKRFIRYKDSLFTFTSLDGIDWNNNLAERILKPIIVQRKISMSFRVNGASKYLLLLGIAQTCKLQKKSFLKFLLSKEKNVDNYKAHRSLVYSRKTS